MGKPITDVIREYRNGELVRNASDDFAALVAAVRTLRKAGSITIRLEVKPDKHSAKEVEVQAVVKLDVPRKGMKAATFFIGAGDELLRNDPEQLDAFVEVVDPRTGEVSERPRMAAVPTPAPRDGTDG